MGRYRKVDVSIWGDSKFRALSSPKPNAKFLWFHLLTGQHTCAIPGLSRSGEAAMAEELGWPLPAFRRCWREIAVQGMAEADWKARVVYLPNAIAYNEPESPSVVKSWTEILTEIPESPLKNKAIHSLGTYLSGMGESWAAAWWPGWESVCGAGCEAASPADCASSGAGAGAGAGTGAGTGAGEPPVVPHTGDALGDTPEMLLALWNEHVPASRKNGLPGFRATKELTDSWHKKAALRLREAELGWHRKAIERLTHSAFACGGSAPGPGHSKPFRATFDWYVSNDTNCVKAYEGRYDN